MILQLVPIDKFTDYVIRQYESYTDIVDTILIKSFVDIKITNNGKTLPILEPNTKDFEDLLLRLSNYSSIIIHGFHWPWVEKIVKFKPQSVKLAWVFWGGEIYGRPENQDEFLTFFTKVILSCHKFKKIFSKVKEQKKYFVPLMSYNKIDYCLSDELEEYKYAKDKTNGNFNYLEYNYYTLEDLLGNLYDSKCSGENILIGNAATVECNYWYTLLKLKPYKLKHTTKIIIPLSYGDLWVRNSVIKQGSFLFGNRFFPLLEFLPLEQYNNTILSCNTMIMPHIQPHAQGNIILGLWLGMRVFLSKKNLSYHYFRRIGCKLYSLEDDFHLLNDINFQCLSDEEIALNRKILYAIYSSESTNRKIQTIINTLK